MYVEGCYMNRALHTKIDTHSIFVRFSTVGQHYLTFCQCIGMWTASQTQHQDYEDCQQALWFSHRMLGPNTEKTTICAYHTSTVCSKSHFRSVTHSYTHILSCTTLQLTAVLKLRTNPHWSTRYLNTGRLSPNTA